MALPSPILKAMGCLLHTKLRVLMLLLLKLINSMYFKCRGEREVGLGC